MRSSDGAADDYRIRVVSPFAAQFAKALAAIPLTQRAFCRRVSYHQGSLQGVLSGRRKPPLKDAETWADTLALSGQARKDFLLAYRLLHAPPEIAALVHRLLSDTEKQRQR